MQGEREGAQNLNLCTELATNLVQLFGELRLKLCRNKATIISGLGHMNAPDEEHWMRVYHS